MNLLDEIQTNILEQELLAKKSTFFDKKFSSSNLDYACELTRALGNTTRMKILNFILSTGRTDVAPIYNKLKLEQSVTSQHISVLRGSGVIQSEKIGKHVYVEVNEQVLLKAEKALSNYFSPKEN